MSREGRRKSRRLHALCFFSALGSRFSDLQLLAMKRKIDNNCVKAAPDDCDLRDFLRPVAGGLAQTI